MAVSQVWWLCYYKCHTTWLQFRKDSQICKTLAAPEPSESEAESSTAATLQIILLLCQFCLVLPLLQVNLSKATSDGKKSQICKNIVKSTKKSTLSTLYEMHTVFHTHLLKANIYLYILKT